MTSVCAYALALEKMILNGYENKHRQMHIYNPLIPVLPPSDEKILAFARQYEYWEPEGPKQFHKEKRMLNSN